MTKYIRFPLIVSGTKEWCLASLRSIFDEIQTEDLLWVSDEGEPKGLKFDGLRAAQSLSPDKIRNTLGGEYQTLIWDGFSGLHPSGMAAASGLVKGGGLFILLLPPFDELTASPDPDYRRMCAFDHELAACNRYFLESIVARCESDTLALLIEDGQMENSRVEGKLAEHKCIDKKAPQISLLNSESLASLKDDPEVELPSCDQNLAIDAIEKVSQGHRNRPLVMTADRGRGKSSVLGLAAATLVQRFQHQIVITAPSKKAAAKAFDHFDSALKAEVNEEAFQDLKQRLSFVPPDLLCEEKPDCHLLLIDEAAAIPAPLLMDLVTHYKRVVFSSTIHGYEGSGRGFEIRFKQYLIDHFSQWTELHLNQSIRWAEGDPLENWTDSLFHLRSPQLNSPKLTELPLFDEDERIQLHFEWVEQGSLAKDTAYFNQIVSLLVNAHYQTTPDDIRLILDHPDIMIGVIKGEIGVVGVILMLKEGEVLDETLCGEIVAGRRRIRGHLAPQSLATHYHDVSLLRHKYLRVMRIAVRPELENKGYGSQLIDEARTYAQKNAIDFLSTSFGFSLDLCGFWLKNRFEFLKLGTHRDKSTGTYSALMAQACHEDAKTICLTMSHKFQSHFEFGLSRQYRHHNPNELLAIIEAFNRPENNDTDITGSVRILERGALMETIAGLRAYSEGYRNLDECALDIARLIFHGGVSDASASVSHKKSLGVLIARALQGRDVAECVNLYGFKGKKDLEGYLRSSVASLLDGIQSTLN